MPRLKEGQDQSCVFISVGGQPELLYLPVISLASLPTPGCLGPNGKACGGGCWAAVGREMLSVRAGHSPAAAHRHTLNSPGFFQQVCALIKPAPHSRCAGRGPPLKAAICQHEGEQKQAFQHHPQAPLRNIDEWGSRDPGLLSKPRTLSRSIFLPSVCIGEDPFNLDLEILQEM